MGSGKKEIAAISIFWQYRSRAAFLPGLGVNELGRLSLGGTSLSGGDMSSKYSFSLQRRVKSRVSLVSWNESKGEGVGQKPFPRSSRERQASGRFLEDKLTDLNCLGVLSMDLMKRLCL